MTDTWNILPFVTPDEKKVFVPPDKKLEKEEEAYDPASAFDDESPPEDEQYDPFTEYQSGESFLVFVFYLWKNVKPEFFTDSL